MLVIGFTGLPCSGKDAACEYLVKNHGYNFLSCGDVVRKFAREVRKIENPDRHQLQQIGCEMRKGEGEDWVLRRLFENIGEGKYVISGVRGINELNFLKSRFKENFALVGLLASRELRFERCLKRARDGDAKTREGFEKADLQDLKLGDGDSTILSDFFVINEGSFQEFYSEVEKIVRKVEKRL